MGLGLAVNHSLSTVVAPLPRVRPLPPDRWARLWATPARAVLAGAVLLAVASLPIFLRTFVNDDASYALIGHKLHAGHLLYRDAVDNKPPLIYALYAGAFALFGGGALVAVKLLSIAVDLACVALVFAIGQALLARRVAAAAAFLFACAAASGVAEDSIAPNTELFMNLFALAAVWLLVRDRELSARTLIAAGLTAALAALFRVQGLVVAGGLGWILVWRLGLSRRLLRAGMIFALAWLAPMVLLVLYLRAQGTLGDFWSWVFRNNFAAVQVGSAEGLTPSKLARVVLAIFSLLPVLLALGPALASVRGTPALERRRLILLLVPLGLGLATYQLGNRLYGHYLIQAVPFACLLGGWTLAHAQAHWRRLIPTMAVAWVAGFGVYNVVHLAQPDGGAPVAAAVKYLRAHTRAGDQILLWGSSTLVPLRADRDFATRFVFNNYLTGRVFGTSHVRAVATPESNRAFENPLAWTLLWRDLEAAPPAAVLDGGTDRFGLASYPELAAYVARHYQAPVRFGPSSLYLRR
jgi:4-amino-4-deoxy-L-arabinose transferase-like glycosyltransferase